jgi:hypothetical protein
MSVRRLHLLPLLWLLIAGLLASPVTSFGYVWCLDDDGHAALETARGGGCGGDTVAPCAADNPDGSASLAAGEDDCGPCLDITAAPHWNLTRGRDGSSPDPQPVFFILPGVTLRPVPADFSSAIAPRPEAVPRRSAQLLAHRTIVLLI